MAAATAPRPRRSRAGRLAQAALVGAAIGGGIGAVYGAMDEPPRGHEYKIPLAGAVVYAAGTLLSWFIWPGDR